MYFFLFTLPDILLLCCYISYLFDICNIKISTLLNVNEITCIYCPRHRWGWCHVLCSLLDLGTCCQCSQIVECSAACLLWLYQSIFLSASCSPCRTHRSPTHIWCWRDIRTDTHFCRKGQHSFTICQKILLFYKLSSFLPFVIFAVIVFIPIFFIKETSVKHDATQEMISVIDRVGY